MNNWDVVFMRSGDHGRTWTGFHDFRRALGAFRVSDRGSGAPYKSSAGFRFPYGDYFGQTVDGRGISYLTWSEGKSCDGPGNTW